MLPEVRTRGPVLGTGGTILVGLPHGGPVPGVTERVECQCCGYVVERPHVPGVSLMPCGCSSCMCRSTDKCIKHCEVDHLCFDSGDYTVQTAKYSYNHGYGFDE